MFNSLNPVQYYYLPTKAHSSLRQCLKASRGWLAAAWRVWGGLLPNKVRKIDIYILTCDIWWKVRK